MAECRAIDEALYQLDSFLSSGSSGLDLSTFLKESKKLSRKLFLNRAHLKKIASQTGTSAAFPSSERSGAMRHATQMNNPGSMTGVRGGGY